MINLIIKDNVVVNYGDESCKERETLIIPEGVEVIGKKALFCLPSFIDKIILPNSLKRIEDFAFAFSDIKEIVMSPNIEYIGVGAFSNCKYIKNIEIPKKVLLIPNSCFKNCKNLEEIKFHNKIISIGSGAFSNTKIKQAVFSNNLVTIGSEAFSRCEELIYVKLSNSIKHLKPFTFAFCPKLEQVDLPKHLQIIEEGTFSGDFSLKYITFPKSLKFIGAFAFDNCRSLTTKKDKYKAAKVNIDGKLVSRFATGNFSNEAYEFKTKVWLPEEKKVELCRHGYHYCPNLFNIFNYYYGELDRAIKIFKCDIVESNQVTGSEKNATSSIRLKKKLSRKQIIKILNSREEENHA